MVSILLDQNRLMDLAFICSLLVAQNLHSKDHVFWCVSLVVVFVQIMLQHVASCGEESGINLQLVDDCEPVEEDH